MSEKLTVSDRNDDIIIPDVDKAHTMALAEDAGRTLARNLKSGAGVSEVADIPVKSVRSQAARAIGIARSQGEKAGRAYDEGEEFTPHNLSEVSQMIGLGEGLSNPVVVESRINESYTAAVAELAARLSVGGLTRAQKRLSNKRR